MVGGEVSGLFGAAVPGDPARVAFQIATEPAGPALVYRSTRAAAPARLHPLPTAMNAAVPSAALRASGLQIVGSGQGAVSTCDILAELSGLAEAVAEGAFDIDARLVPLADVEQAWADAAASPQRIVLMPG